jgi:hypothetical protein
MVQSSVVAMSVGQGFYTATGGVFILEGGDPRNQKNGKKKTKGF